MTTSRILAALFCFLLPFAAQAQIAGGGTGSRIGSVGTWTPAVTASSTAGTPAYTTAVGSYVRMGNWVYVQFDLVLSGWTGSPSGNVTITGLPFTSTATASDNGGCTVTQYTVSALSATTYGLTGVIAPSATVASIYSDGNAGVSTLTAAEAGTTPTLIGSVIITNEDFMTVIRNELDIAKIILQVADQLNSKGKGYIKEIVDATIALPESAKKQAVEAQTLIAQGNSLKADIKKQADDANERLAIRERAVKVREAAAEDAKAIKAEAEAIAAKNVTDKADLRKESERLDGITKLHAATTKKHADTLAEIAEKNRLLGIENKKLEDKRKEIADYETQVTSAADEMSGLIKAKLVKRAR